MFIILNLLEVMHVRWSLHQSPRTMSTDATQRERIFIAGTHWNSEVILRSHWNSAVLQLTQHLGAENVFVSIVESGSWDGTKVALGELDVELGKAGIRRSIVTSNTTHADEISRLSKTQGWVVSPGGGKELRRIPYLSRIRNLSLEPLQELAAKGITFDKVLFLNDVVFTVRIHSDRSTVGGMLTTIRSKILRHLPAPITGHMLWHVLWTSRNRLISTTHSPFVTLKDTSR